MYQNCNFIENFEKTQSTLMTLLKEKIKDPGSKKQLEEMSKLRIYLKVNNSILK